MIRCALLLLLVSLLGCGDDDAPARPDAGSNDAGRIDAGRPGDAGRGDDAGSTDAGDVPAADDLDPILEPIRAAAGLPAMAAVVYEGETLLAAGAVGVRAAGDPTEVTTNDRWHLGSDTKAMTATVIALFVETGLLDWDMTVAEAFPGFSIHPGYTGVTLAHLLAHRGGMDPEHDWLTPYWSDSRYVEEQRAEVAETLLGAPPVAAVGTFSYANSGYVVAGAALEAATGRSWEEIMRTDLFTPLGMTSCGFGAPGTAGVIDEPRGHSGPPPDPIEPGPSADNHPILGPAGTAHCTLADWAKFVAMHMAGARGEETALLPASAYTRMHTAWPGGDYALGWGIADRPWAGGLTLVHAGSNTLWFVIAWVAPARDRFMLLATNMGEGADMPIDEVAGELVERYFP